VKNTCRKSVSVVILRVIAYAEVVFVSVLLHLAGMTVWESGGRESQTFWELVRYSETAYS
jgi:hypothetical protein